MIELSHVTYTYPDQAGPALADFSVAIRPGEFVLVVGPSGAGKSTFLRCLNGLVPHFYGGRWAGRVNVLGRDPVALAPRGMADLVGFVFQDPEAQFVVDTVEDELAFAMENFALAPATMRKRVEEALDQMTIAHLRDRRVGTLSGGEKQRVAIAAVLALQPEILALDEPTSQLDPQAAEEVLIALRHLNEDLGLTIILSEHRLERVVQYADRVLYLPGLGQPPLLADPRTVMAALPLVPPLIELGRRLGWQPLPLTIKEGRAQARLLGEQIGKSANQRINEWVNQRINESAPVVSARGVHYAYDGHAALRGVSLEATPGEFVALMGRNGSGKSTLLKQLVGLQKPDQGQVFIIGLDTRRAALEEIIRTVGYVPQHPGALLFQESVTDELAFTRRSHRLPADAAADRQLLERLGLGAVAGRNPRDLSGGEQQRAALAAILVAGPQLILLDEPTRGLDYEQKHRLAALLTELKREGRTIIMATHDVELAAACADRVVLMAEGQIVVDGPARQVMSDSQVFSSQINKLFRDPRFLVVEDVLQVLQ
ncbi:MAG: energy-coupling factor transport system ATP-binding protein [Chloroflexota bacterium]|nr:energy-coupling factor transport system ATP-binding protein [Chloroflexota bacterium]